jgi:hypothetical protein
MFIAIDLGDPSGGGGMPSPAIHGNEKHTPEVYVEINAGDTADE